MKRSLLVLPIVFALYGCSGSGKTMVLNTPSEMHMAKTYKIQEGKSTVGAGQEVKALFEKEIASGLSEAGMKDGNDIIIDMALSSLTKVAD